MNLFPFRLTGIGELVVVKVEAGVERVVPVGEKIAEPASFWVGN